MLSTFSKVATVGEVGDGQMTSVSPEGEAVLLARIGEDYFAINNVCTHFFTLLTDGEIFPDTCEVQCPLHDSRFNLKTGDPTEPPAEDPEEVYAVKVDGDDILIGPTT
jgi:nitrite reductase/ring-hydroxylating ferredoxin subunit